MKLSRLWLLLVLPVLLYNCKAKQVATTPVDPTPVDIAYTPLDNALLWKITHPSAQIPTSYLFGTIHMIDAEDYFEPYFFQEAIKSVDEIVFEIDIDDMMNMGSQFSMLTKIFMKGGATLEDFLSDDEYSLVSTFFEEKGLPMMFLKRIKPLFLSAMTEFDMNSFSMEEGMPKAGGDIKSYEMEINELAKQNEKETDGLETVEYQMSVFDNIPYEAQAQMLVEAVKVSGLENSELQQMIDAYKNQNIEALVQSISESEDYAEFENILLNDRNENWIPIISKKVAERSTFFAVGAGHLAGKKGVIHLLKEAGYQLTPVFDLP